MAQLSINKVGNLRLLCILHLWYILKLRSFARVSYRTRSSTAIDSYVSSPNMYSKSMFRYAQIENEIKIELQTCCTSFK